MTRKQKIEFLKKTMSDRPDIIFENLSDNMINSAYLIEQNRLENTLLDQVSIL